MPRVRRHTRAVCFSAIKLRLKLPAMYNTKWRTKREHHKNWLNLVANWLFFYYQWRQFFLLFKYNACDRPHKIRPRTGLTFESGIVAQIYFMLTYSGKWIRILDATRWLNSIMCLTLWPAVNLRHQIAQREKYYFYYYYSPAHEL